MSKYSFLTKPELLGSLACLALALSSSTVWLLALLATLVYTLTFYLTPTSERWRSTYTTLIVWGFILLGCLPLLFSQVSEGLWGWGITSNSIQTALTVALRATAAFGAVRLLLVLIPIYELCRGLRSVGVPTLLVELIELSYRYIYLLLSSAEQIRLSQLQRMGYTGNLAARYADASLLVSRSFVLAHSSANQLYDGLLSRGFEPQELEAPSPTNMNNESKQSQQETSPLLHLERISYAYNKDEETLTEINCSITRGERIALLGENGAGKSTLMLVVSGLIPQYQGYIYLNGQKLTNSRADTQYLRQRVALVFQNSNHQLFCPTVEDEIAFGLRNRGLSGKELSGLVETTIEQYGLAPLRSKAPHQLSEGQKKWVALAAVLATEPDIILLDEPTAALDRYYTNKVLSLLELLSSQGKTIILSTHDMQLVARWAERTLVMHQGKLLADTLTTELWQMPHILSEANLERPLHLAASTTEIQNPSPKLSVHKSEAPAYRLLLAHEAGQRAFIVGAGVGARRKLHTLLEGGYICEVLAPEEAPSTLAEYLATGKLLWRQGLWDSLSQIPTGIQLVVAATGRQEIDLHIAELAQARGLLYTSLSHKSVGNIQFVAQGGEGIRLGVHTDYQLPELSQRVRDRGLELIQPIPTTALQELMRLRQAWLSEHKPEAYNEYQNAINNALNGRVHKE